MTRRLLIGYVTITLFVAAVLAIPFGLFFAARQRERFTVALERDATVLAAFYEDALQEGLTASPEPGLAYAAQSGARVVVTNQAGITLVDSGGGPPRDFSSRPEVQEALSGRRSSGSRHSNTLDTDLFYVAVPVASGDNVFGSVRLTFPTAEVDRQIHRFWFGLGVVALIAMAGTVTIGVVVSRSVTRPIRELQVGANAIAGGDFTVQIDAADAPAELWTLAGVFNQMTAKVGQMLESQHAFVGDASHQLRTPLTALRLRLENLGTGITESVRDDYEAVIGELERMSALVDQLLELSRSSEGGERTETVDLRDAIKRRTSLWEAAAEESGKTITADVNNAPVEVSTVPGAVDQILDNLVDNALRHTPRGTAVRIVLEPDGPFHVMHVIDAGPGLSPEERDRVFDRFWRGQTDTNGTGLGMAIVKHLTERSGGTVGVDAAADGGLDVAVRLPAEPVPGSGSPGEHVQRIPPESSGQTGGRKAHGS